jgi:hypothetical protein
MILSIVTRHRKPALGVLLGSLAVAAIAVSVALFAGTPSARSGPDDWGTALQQASVPSGLLVWMMPGPTKDVMTGDGPIYARVANSAGELVTTEIGYGVRAQLLCGGKQPTVMLETDDGPSRVVRFDSDSGAWTDVGEPKSASEVTTATASETAVAFATHDESGRMSVAVTASDSTSSESTEYSFEPLPPNPSLVARWAADPQCLVDIDSRPKVGTVTSLTSKGSDIFAFRCTELATVVQDLSQDTSADLSDYSWVPSAGLGGDGIIYFAAQVPGRGRPEHVVGLNPSKLTVVSDVDTGWKNQPNLSAMMWIPSQAGVTLVIREVRDEKKQWGSMLVWRISKSGASRLPDLPVDAGILAGFGHDGTVLVYGGPAKSVVTRLDPETDAMSVVDSMTAPEGSRVLLAVE